LIVRCERCETRFKLDPSRLPARGARVRCSRCKHAFFVIPPGSSREEFVHDLAADAAAASPPSKRVPEPAWDLEEGASSTSASVRGAESASTGSAVASAADAEDPNDWHFENDLPGFDADAGPAPLGRTGVAAAPAFASAPDADEDSFADLGDPETWDLLADDPPAAAPGLAIPAAEAAATAPSPEPVSAPVELRAPETLEHAIAPQAARVRANVSAAAHSDTTTRGPAAEPAHPVGAVQSAGWAAAAVLSALVAWASVPARMEAPVSLAPIAGFEVLETRIRIVENATAGPILVVSGRLRNPGSEPRVLESPLEIQLLDADGLPLAGSSAVAGPSLSERRVREETPEQLRTGQKDAAGDWARRPLGAGAERAFDAVFAERPPAATRIALTTHRPESARRR
jgi:predicted Zn finger-like uncharacterized protein